MDPKPKAIDFPEKSRRMLEYFNSYFTVFPDILSVESHKLWFRHTVDRIQILLELDSLGALKDPDVSRRLLNTEDRLYNQALVMNSRELETALFSGDTTRKPPDSLREADPGYLAAQALELERIRLIPTKRRFGYPRFELERWMDIYRLLQPSTKDFRIVWPGILRRDFVIGPEDDNRIQELITPSDSYFILGERKIINNAGVGFTLFLVDEDPDSQLPLSRCLFIGPSLLKCCEAIAQAIEAKYGNKFCNWFNSIHNNGMKPPNDKYEDEDWLLETKREEILTLAQVIAMYIRFRGNRPGIHFSNLRACLKTSDY